MVMVLSARMDKERQTGDVLPTPRKKITKFTSLRKRLCTTRMTTGNRILWSQQVGDKQMSARDVLLTCSISTRSGSLNLRLSQKSPNTNQLREACTRKENSVSLSFCRFVPTASRLTMKILGCYPTKDWDETSR